MSLTHDGVVERRSGVSRYLIARRDAEDADVLVLRLPDGRTALPVFGREEEAGMFLWLETAGEGWRVAEFSEGDLVTLLRGSCAGVGCVVYPFATKGVARGPATVGREDYLRELSGKRARPGAEDGHEFPTRSSEREGEDPW